MHKTTRVLVSNLQEASMMNWRCTVLPVALLPAVLCVSFVRGDTGKEKWFDRSNSSSEESIPLSE
eukprot:3682453-Rhodomonas_salina.1